MIDVTTTAQTTKEKIRLHQNQKLNFIKGHRQKSDKTEWGKIFTNHVFTYGLVSIIEKKKKKNLFQLNNKKTNHLVKK